MSRSQAVQSERATAAFTLLRFGPSGATARSSRSLGVIFTGEDLVGETTRKGGIGAPTVG